MKNIFHNLPIRMKLTAAIVVASFLVLLLFSSAFVTIEIYSFRNTMINDISIMAELLGINSRTAMISKQKWPDTDALNSLSSQPHIRSAYLFNSSGEPISQYLDPDSFEFISKGLTRDFAGIKPEDLGNSQQRVIHSDWKRLSVLTPVFYRGEKIGSIYLLMDNQALYSRILDLLFGVFLSIGLMIPVSMVLARYLTNPIARPLLSLATKMATISRKSDFTIRAVKRSNDEVGDLVDGFNHMLLQIQLRDSRLTEHQKYLEETVSNRTKELQETVVQLEKSKLDADKANQAKSEFLANMTHELRTPLIGVLGMNELLARTEMSDQQQSLVATVQRSGEDLLAIINDILDFSKIEAGHLSLENIDVDIFRVVEETTHLLAEKAYEKGIGISCHVLPTAMWKVRTDPVRIRQILLNLISNAVKFTLQGAVMVRLDMTMSGPDLGCFVLEVKDTGVGMNKEAQAKVFSAFVQADSTTTRQYGGTGLGLAIVQQLVTLMGGKLSLESQEGLGSLFRVELTLPLMAYQLPQLPDSLRGRRILLYDEDLSVRHTVQMILAELGMQVVEATSVEDAWYRLLTDGRQEFPFDFAFVSTEARFPDGGPLYEKIGQEKLLSGLRTIGVCSRLTLVGATYPKGLHVLEKPVLWSNLINCLVRSWKKIELVSSPVVAIAAKGSAPTAQPAISLASEQHKILLADDNAVTRELIRLSLQKYSFKIDQAVSGTEVLAALKTQTYDLILMDCNMPELDGIETTRRLRQQGCHVPIVALTAHADQRIFASCEAAGMNDSLRKPFRQKELHGLVEKWLKLEEYGRSTDIAAERGEE